MSCKGRILIADRTHEVLEERLREAGFAVSVEPDHDYESLAKAAQGCVGLVVRSKVIVDRGFIDRVPSLRCIGRVGAGMETIDVDYAESRGVRCLNSPEGNRDAVGEHAVGLLLALLWSLAGGILAHIAVSFGIGHHNDLISIGNIMFYIPGIAFTNSIRDLFYGDTISGVIRFLESVILAITIAIGFTAAGLIL